MKIRFKIQPDGRKYTERMLTLRVRACFVLTPSKKEVYSCIFIQDGKKCKAPPEMTEPESEAYVKFFEDTLKADNRKKENTFLRAEYFRVL
jgi:hypothetical protein